MSSFPVASAWFVGGKVGVSEDCFVIKEDVWSDLMCILKKQASPGVPFMYDFATNERLILEPAVLKPEVESRLRKLYSLGESLKGDLGDPTQLFVDPQEGVRLVQQGFCDPSRTFGKNEPHKLGKPTRLIVSMSVVDSIVDMILVHQQLSTEIHCVQVHQAEGRHWPHPVTVGFDLNTKKGRIHFYERIIAKIRSGLDMAQNDTSGFDASFHVACHHLYQTWWDCMGNRAAAQGMGPEVWWRFVHLARAYCRKHRVLMTSDGMLLALCIAVMGSGEKQTAHGDSVVRALLCTLAQFIFCEGSPKRITWFRQELEDAVMGIPSRVPVSADTNGDDCVEDKLGLQLTELTACYARLGFALTDSTPCEGNPISVTFCSQILTPDGGRPEAYGKALFNLLQKPIESADSIELLTFWSRYVSTGLILAGNLERVAPKLVATLNAACALMSLPRTAHAGQKD